MSAETAASVLAGLIFFGIVYGVYWYRNKRK